MTYKFFETKRRHVAIIDNELFATNRDYTNKEFSKLEEKVFIPANTVSIEAETIEDAYYNYVGVLMNERKQKKEAAEVNEKWADDVKINLQNYSALEIWKAARIINNRQYAGWQAADMLLETSAFSKAIFKTAKTYTVTPFDDNTLLIKVDGKRYGNKRGWADIEDLLS